MQTHSARVVVGVDGSPGSRSALVVALGEAARRGADLDVVVACPLVEPWTLGPPLAVPDVAWLLADGRARGRALLAEARKDQSLTTAPEAARVRAAVVAVERPPAAALVERSTGAELLVVGSRGRGAARSTLLGSVALHCATRARCPVLVVHGEPGSAPPAAPVVVGLEGSAPSREALRQAADEAERLGADLEVVTAYIPMSYWGDLYAVMAPPSGRTREQAEERARAVLREVLGSDGGGSGVTVVVEQGDAGRVLTEKASGARLLVVGSECRSRLEGMILGSVALHCVVHARCPVLVVHPRPAVVPDAETPVPPEPVTLR